MQSFYRLDEKSDDAAGSHQQQKASQIRPAVLMATIHPFVTSNQPFISFIQQGITDNERGLLQYFSSLDHQSLVLCSMWLFAMMRSSMDVFHMPSK
jgi:hypothetical protein